MSLKFGKLVLVPQNNEQEAQVLKPSGNSFKFGYYMFCDYIHEHPKAKGIHCEINCDAFGRVTILNFSKEHPIILNGRAVRSKRHLLNGNIIEILDKKFQWFYSTKRTKTQEGTDVTPKQKIHIRQMPFSEPSRKKTRGDILHSFTVQTRKEQQSEESDSAIEMEKVYKEKDDAKKGNRDSFKENISQSLINITEKDCFVAAENVTPSKKLNLSCNRSETVFTSYSPKVTDSRFSKSFSFITPTKGSPKSLYGTPRSVLSEKNDNLSKSFDLIEFSTPYNKLEKRSMHLIDLTSAGKLIKTPQRTGSPLLKSALKNSAKSIKRLPQKFTTITEENCNKSLTLKSALKNTSLKNSKLVASPKKVQLFADNNSTLEKTVTISPYIEEITINSTKDSTIDVDQFSSTCIESVIEISEDDTSKNLPNTSKLRTPTSAKSLSNSVKTPSKITPKIAQQKSVSKIADKKIIHRTLSRSAVAGKMSNSVQKDKITKLNTSSLAIRKRSKSVSFEPNNRKPMMSALIRGKQDVNLKTSTPIVRQSISFRRNLENIEGRITPKRHSCYTPSTPYSTKKPPVLSAKKTPTLVKRKSVPVKNTEDVLNTTFSIETPTSELDKLPDHSFKIDEKPDNNAGNTPVASNCSKKRKTLRMSVIEKTSYSMSKDISHPTKEKSSNVSSLEKFSRENTPLKVSSELGVSKKLFNTPVKALDKSETVVDIKEKSAKSKGEQSTMTKSEKDKLTGIKQLLKTPKTPMRENFVGVRELMSTPKVNQNLNLSGVREMLNSPVVNQNSILEGVDARKSCYESVKESMCTPKCKNDKTNIVNKKDGVNCTAEDNLNRLKSEKIPSSPKLTGIKELFTTPNILSNESLDGIQEIFKTPSAKMVMMIGTPKSVNVNKNTSSVELQPALFDPRENMDEMEDIFKTPISNLLERTINKQGDCELSAEESFDKLVGRRSIKYSYTRKTKSPIKSPIKHCDFVEADSELPKTDIEEWVDNVNKSFEIEDNKNTPKSNELSGKNETNGIDLERQNKTFSSELSEALIYSDDETQDFEKSKQAGHCTEKDITENRFISEKQEKLRTPIAHNSETKSNKSIPTESNKRSAAKQTMQKVDLTPRYMTLRARSNTPVLQLRSSTRINQSLRDISVDNIEAKTPTRTPRKSQRITANQSQKNTSLVLESRNRSNKEEKSADFPPKLHNRRITRLSMCSTPKSRLPRISHEVALKSDSFKLQRRSKTPEISQGKPENSDEEFPQELVIATENNLSATQKILDHKCKSPNLEFSQSDLEMKKVSENFQQEQSLQSIRENDDTLPLDNKSLEIQKVFENFKENPEIPSERTGKSFCNNIKENEMNRRTSRTMGNVPTTEESFDIQNLKDQLEIERAFENFKDHPEHLGKRGQSISPVIEKKQLRLSRKTLGYNATTSEPLDVKNLKTQLEMKRAFENFQENAEPRPTRTARSISPIVEKKSQRLPRKTLGSKPTTDEPLDVENLKVQLEIERAFENFQDTAEPRSIRTARSISCSAKKTSSRLTRKTLGSKPATDESLDVENLKYELEMERAFENFQEKPEPKSTRTVRSISPIVKKKSSRLPRKTLGSKPATEEPLDIENLKDQLEMERAFENFQENAEPRSTRTVRSISPIAKKKSLKLPRKTLGSKPATDEPLDIENLKDQLEMERAFENFQENAEPRSTRRTKSISPIAERKSLRLPRKTLGSKPTTDEPLDVEKLKVQLEMERAFENFQEKAVPKSTRTVRSISPIVEKKSSRLPRKTLGSKPATDEPLDVEDLKSQLEMERAFENFQEKAEPKSTRTVRSISPIAEKKQLRLPRKTLGSKPATDEPLDIENLKYQVEMERAFENFQENSEPRSTRTVRSISAIAEKKSLRLPRKTLGSKPATDEPLDIENLKDQLEMERAFENFQENAEPRSSRRTKSISPIVEKKSLRLPRKTLGSKPTTDEPLDVEKLKVQLEMERAFENFQETAEPRSTRTVRSISPIVEKKSSRLPRKTLGSKPATDEPLDIENLKYQVEMERAFENFQENAEPRSTRTVRSISPIAEKKSLRLPRKTLGSKPPTDEPLDIENLKYQVEMERAFENFQENAEPRSTRTVRSISPIAEKKSLRLPRKTLGSKPATDEPLDIENLKYQVEMERAFENFQENAEPRSTRTVKSISPIAEKKSLRLPRKTLGSKPAADEPLDIENLKDQLEMERAFENFQENAEPRSTRTVRSISPIAEKKSLRLPRKTLGSKPATDEPLDIENLKDQLEMERAFENFKENTEPRSTRTVRSISPIAEKKSLRLPRKTLGSKPAADEPLDIENLKEQLEMERAFENFQENAEPRSTRTVRSISPIVEKKSLRLPRKTLGNKPTTDEPLDVENLKSQLEMERAFENFQENAEPRSTRKVRSISPISEKKSLKLPRKTIGSKPTTDEPLDVKSLKAQLEMERAFEDFQDRPNYRQTRGVKSLSPVTDQISLRHLRMDDATTKEPLDARSPKAKSTAPIVNEKQKRNARTTIGGFSANRNSYNVQSVEAESQMRAVFENFQNKHKISNKTQIEEIGITDTIENSAAIKEIAENFEIEKETGMENFTEDQGTVNSDKLEKQLKDPVQESRKDPDEIASNASPAIKRRRYVKKAEKVEQAAKAEVVQRITRTRRHKENTDVDIDAGSEKITQNRNVEKLQIKVEQTEDTAVIESKIDNSSEQTNSAEISKSKSERVKRKVTFLTTDLSPNVSKGAKGRRGRKVTVSKEISVDENLSNTADIISESIKSKQESGEPSEIEIIQEKRPTRNLRKEKRIVETEKLEEGLEDERQNRENDSLIGNKIMDNSSQNLENTISSTEIKMKIQEIEGKETTSTSTRRRRKNIERSESESDNIVEHESRITRRNRTKKLVIKESAIVQEVSETSDALVNNSEMSEKGVSSQNEVANLATVKKEPEEVTEETENVKEVMEKNQNLRKRRGRPNKNANEAAEPSESLETDEIKNTPTTKRVKLDTSSKKENISEASKTVEEESENKTPVVVNAKRTRGKRLAETSKNIDAKAEIVCDQSSNDLQLEENGENQITIKEESKTRTRLARSRKINKDADNDDNQISENNQLSITSDSAQSDEHKKNLNMEKQNLSESIETENSTAKIRKRGRPPKLNTNIETEDEAQKENRRPTRKRAAVVENVVKPKEKIVVKEEHLTESAQVEKASAVESNDLDENSQNKNKQKLPNHLDEKLDSHAEESRPKSKGPAETTDNDTADELQTSTPIRKSRRNAAKSNKLEFNESKETKEETVFPSRTRRRKVEAVVTENPHISTNNDESVETTTAENDLKKQENTKKINVPSTESTVDAALEFKTPIKAAPRAARRLRSNSVTSTLTPILADHDVKILTDQDETNPSDSILSNDSTHMTSETKITRRGTRRNKKNDESNQEESGTSLSTTNEEKDAIPARRTRRLATIELDDSVIHEESPVKGRTRKAKTILTSKSVDDNNVSQFEESLPPKKMTKSKKAVEEAEPESPIPTSKRTLRSRK